MASSNPDKTAGVIGVRGIGAVHLRELSRGGVRRLMVAGRTPAAMDAGELSAKLGCEVTVAASVEALAEGCDFVSVCSPNELHLAHARACLERGCHVLVEKPMFWIPGASQLDIARICATIFEEAEGRLAVNYPTRFFADTFTASCGQPGKVDQFVFRYQTRGNYSGDQIAVDLLPHGFSLLLAFRPAARPVIVERYSADDKWGAVLKVGESLCRFEFLQDPTAEQTALGFAVNGQRAERLQVPAGDGFAVALDLPGVSDTPVAMENPMATSIGKALRTCLSGTTYKCEPARSQAIMELMAATILE